MQHTLTPFDQALSIAQKAKHLLYHSTFQTEAYQQWVESVDANEKAILSTLANKLTTTLFVFDQLPQEDHIDYLYRSLHTEKQAFAQLTKQTLASFQQVTLNQITGNILKILVNDINAGVQQLTGRTHYLNEIETDPDKDNAIELNENLLKLASHPIAKIISVEQSILMTNLRIFEEKAQHLLNLHIELIFQREDFTILNQFKSAIVLMQKNNNDKLIQFIISNIKIIPFFVENQKLLLSLQTSLLNFIEKKELLQQVNSAKTSPRLFCIQTERQNLFQQACLLNQQQQFEQAFNILLHLIKKYQHGPSFLMMGKMIERNHCFEACYHYLSAIVFCNAQAVREEASTRLEQAYLKLIKECDQSEMPIAIPFLKGLDEKIKILPAIASSSNNVFSSLYYLARTYCQLQELAANHSQCKMIHPTYLAAIQRCAEEAKKHGNVHPNDMNFNMMLFDALIDKSKRLSEGKRLTGLRKNF